MDCKLDHSIKLLHIVAHLMDSMKEQKIEILIIEEKVSVYEDAYEPIVKSEFM